MNKLSHRPDHPSFTGGRGIRAAATALACSAALFLGACVEEGSDPTGPEVEEAVGLTVDTPRVTLHSAGTGELKALRYSGAAGDSGDEEPREQGLTLSVSDGFTQSVVPAAEVDPAAPKGGDTSTMRIPATAVITAAEPSEDDALPISRQVELAVGQPTFTDPDLAEDITSTAGFTMGSRTDDRGQQSALTFAAPVEATDTGRRMMEQYLLKYASLPIVFPEDEVGVGASWSVDSRVSGESALLQTVTFTVTGLSGEVVDLDVSVSQRPSLGAIEIGQDTTGVTEDTPEQLTVLNSNTTSTGAVSVDLTQPVPTAGEVSWTTRVIYGGGADDIRVVQDSTTSISFDS